MKQYDLSRKIIDTTHALIVVLDTEGRIVMFNRACERVSGYRFEEVSGRPIWDILLVPEEIDGVKAVFEELRTGHFPNTFENHWVAKSGERRFIEWSNSAVTGESGRVTHVIGTGIDVTEKPAAERALRDSEGRFRQLADNLPLVFWVRELPSKRISYVSPAYEAIWGRKLVDLDEAFRSFLESIHPDDREMLFRQMERETEAHDAAETEYRIIRPDGSVRWIHSRAVPVCDQAGKVNNIIGFAEDITGRKSREQALREAQQRQNALLDSISDPAWFKDDRGRIIAANRAYAARFGLEPADLVGKTVFDFLAPEQAERICAEDWHIMANGTPLRAERPSHLPSSDRWFDVIKTPIGDTSGKITGIAGVARDITERKCSEHAIHEAQQRQKALLGSIPDIAWLKDSEGRYVAVNKLFGQVFNVDTEQIAGKTDFDIFTQVTAAQFAAEDRAVMASGELSRHEELLSRAVGQKWMETVKVPIKNDAGEIIGIAGTSRDITDRKRAEDDMKRSRERLQLALEGARLALWDTNAESGKVFLSERWAEMLGEPQRETRTTVKELLQLVHPEDRQRVLDAAVLAMKGARPDYAEEHRVRTVTGEWRWVLSRGRVTERAANGRAARMSGTNLDITDRKQAEKMLQEAQQRQKALLDAIPDSVWLADTDGHYIEVNRGYGERWGVDPSSVIGKSVFDVFPAALAAGNAAEDREVLRTSKPRRIEKHRVIRGREYWLDIIKVPVTDDAGKVTGIAGISRDITERKLSEANRIARDAALRTAFVKDLHHRIKNNLQGVVTLVERWATQHPEHTDLWDAVITRINAIAAVHGLHGSTGEPELRLDQTLLRLVSSLKSLFGDLPVQLSICSNPATVRVTESEIVPLALIVNELIMNSVKHSRSSVDSKAVDVALDSAGDSARVIFRNHTGKLPAQFDFDTGAGLSTGLSLVKSLLPNHGALLRFENMAGPGGVTVELTLRPPVITFAASET